MNKTRNIMWGLICVLIAGIIIISQLGYLGEIGIWSLILTIILVPVSIMSIIHLNFSGFLFPLAIIGILYAEPLGIESLTPWPILLVALFLSIGLSFLFPAHRRYFKKDHEKLDDGFETVINEPDGSEVKLAAKFSGSVKYVNTDHLKTVIIDASFGGLKVFFDHAKLADDQAIIDVNLNFAGAELYIPKNWKVVDRIDCMLGGVEEKGVMADVTDKTILLKGKASFSGVTVIHI